MRAQLLPPVVADDLETILGEGYRRLGSGAAPTEVAAWITALAYHPPDGVDPHARDADAIVEYAVAYRPITL